MNLRYSPRRRFFEDVIPVPAEATESTAVISSDELYPFEQTAFGEATVFVKGDNSKMSEANASLTAKVSFDEGETWIDAETVTIDNSSFSFTVEKVEDYVPRLKLELDMNGMSLDEDHGLSVDVLFQEAEDNYRGHFERDVLEVPSEVENPDSDEVLEGKAVEMPTFPSKAMAIFTADASKLTADLNARLQSSFDGENWWDLGSEATQVAGSDYELIESGDSDIIGKYVRFNLTVDSTAGVIAEDHEINVDLIAFDRG